MTVTIIAEVGLTHDGSLGNALRMVEVFAEAGADAVKFQDHRWQEVDSGQTHPSPGVREFRQGYYRRTLFSNPQWVAIRETCHVAEVEFIVSPFGVQAVEWLEKYSPPDRYKVASGEVTNLPLLRAIRDTGRPVLLSSGMSTREEQLAANQVFGYTGMTGSEGPKALNMLCNSEYPCPPDRAFPGIKRLRRGAEWFPWGLSDHSPPESIAACLAAVTLGATVLERHVTLSRHMYGSDSWMSMEPDDFARLVREVRALEKMLASTKSKDELVQSPEIQKAREVFLNVAE